MNEKLKTLKDLRSTPKIDCCPTDWLLNESDLKAEAVKWVKDCPHCKFVKYRQQDNNEDVKELSARDFCLSCLKFMRFFNITEKDLE